MVYEIGKEGFSQGGVKNRLTKKWIIKPCANWIVKGHSTYVVQKTKFIEKPFSNDVNYYSIYNIYGEVIKDSLNESDILSNYEYLKMMVPFYQCDTVFFLNDDFKDFFYPHKLCFKVDGKTGFFYLTTNYIKQKPVDFFLKSFANIETTIEKDSVVFKLNMDANKLRFNLKEGFTFTFYSIIESDSYKDNQLLRIKSNTIDSVYILEYAPYSNSERKIIKLSYSDSYLTSLIENPYYNDCYRLNGLWNYKIEVYENSLINVTNNKVKFFEESPKYNSGIYDLKNHVWMIENKYHSIIKKDECYIAYKLDPKLNPEDFDVYSLRGKLLK